ncbi:MAG: sigma-70 family RNA polymerase sigma factor [Candidatus Carbobacillus altaicus]|nr:sigma-70 family RNA polymerase sigma factor [Candidatus Carbobacillus altaicus]
MIVRAVKEGHIDQFAKLIACYEGRLRHFIKQYLTAYHMHDMVDDLLQETFLKAYHHIHDFRDDEAQFSTWLYTIAKNTVLSELRRSYHQDLAYDDQLLARRPAPEKQPEQSAVLKETAQYVQDAIQTLPERQRACVVLREYEELDYKDIASRLGLSVSSVKSLLFRARQSLRQKLEPYVLEKTPEGADT